MKCKFKAKDFMAAVKTALAVHDFGDSSDSRQPCVLTAQEDQLIIESAKLGAYVVKRIPAKLLRPGSVALNAEELAEMKLTNEVEADGADDSTMFKDKHTRYTWANDDTAQKEIVEQREALDNVKAQAKIPTQLMKSGADFTTYKSETGDMDIQVTLEKGKFEYVTLDFLGSARYVFSDTDVKSKKRLYFILNTNLIGKIMKHATGDELTIGVTDDSSIVRLRTEDLDLFHPTIDKKYMSTDKLIKAVTGRPESKKVCQFVADQKALKDAIERVMPAGKKAESAVMEIRADKKSGVKLHLSSATTEADSQVETHELKMGKKPIAITIRATYLQEFAKAAPSLPITVESWNEKYLRMYVKEENLLIEYVAMMISE